MANEIKVVRESIIELFEKTVNDCLKDGWELVNIQAVAIREGRLEHVAYLKRKSY